MTIAPNRPIGSYAGVALRQPLARMQSSFVGNVKAFQATRVAPAARPSRLCVPVIENRVSLRFQRFGRKHLPFYRLVAIDSKDRRDGKPLEYLGCVPAAPAPAIPSSPACPSPCTPSLSCDVPP